MKIHHAWKLMLLFVLTMFVIVGWGRYRHRHLGELKCVFLDVGQGDAAVLETPSGKVMIVDSGGISEHNDDNEGLRTVAPFLRHEGINTVALLVLTHPHADHIGGATTVLDEFNVETLLDNGQNTDSVLETRVLTAAHHHGTAYKAGRRGQEIDFGDGVTAHVLGPTEAETSGSPNNASVVLRVEYGRTSFVFTGDAERDEETDILASGASVAGTVLKVGHHGSHTSTTPEFLAAVHPRYAIISVGEHNRYGHPSADVVGRLGDCGAHVYRTDRNGAVTCTSDGVSVTVESMRR